MEKLNIAMFTDAFYPMIDGVITVIDNIAKRLNKTHNVTVFAPRGKTDFDDSTLPYKVVRCKKIKVPTIEYVLATPAFDKNFKNALIETKFDIVHIHSPFTIGKAGVKYAKEHNIPVVASLHSQFKQDFKKSVKADFIVNMMVKSVIKVFDSCSEVWPVNKSMVDVFRSYNGKNKTNYLNNATDFKLVTNDGEVEAIRKELNIAKNEKIFLFVGRINTLKNILFTCDVLKILKMQNFKFKMIFVGDGPDTDKLKAKIKNLEIENECLLLGKITNRQKIANLYKLADLFIFPSKYDACSLVQIEAASQKTPTIFISGTVTSGTVTQDVNGYMSEEDPQIFANKIIEIFKDKTKYKEVCENAYRDLYSSWDDYVKVIEQRYLTLIKNEHKD